MGAENTMKSIYSKLILKSEYKEKSKRIEKIIVKIHIDEFNCDKNLVNSNRVSSLEKNHWITKIFFLGNLNQNFKDMLMQQIETSKPRLNYQHQIKCSSRKNRSWKRTKVKRKALNAVVFVSGKIYHL